MNMPETKITTNKHDGKKSAFLVSILLPLLVSTLLTLASPSCKAGISEDLMGFFKSTGMASNVTSPGAYQDQTAGFYTGGSIVTRNAVRNAQIATIQMPG